MSRVLLPEKDSGNRKERIAVKNQCIKVNRDAWRKD